MNAHWDAVSEDPNSYSAVEWRRRRVAESRVAHTLVDRIPYFCSLVDGKSILDIGVVAHTSSAVKSQNWLHGHLRQRAAQCLGADILEPQVRELNALGYNVVVADITKAPLEQKFDVIIAGEVIEHIDEPGMFMQSCAAMLNPSGRLALSTPNPVYLNVILKSMFRRNTFIDSVDHVAWYDAATLCELGERYGLRLDRHTGIASKHPTTFNAHVLNLLTPLLIAIGFSSTLFAKSIIYEFVSS